MLDDAGLSPSNLRDAGAYSSDEEVEEVKQDRKYKDGDLNVFREIINEERQYKTQS